MIESVADLYGLTTDQLEALEGFAAKAATQLVEAIEASKAQPLSKLLFALGIRHVGSEGAKLLAGRFRTMDALMAAGAAEIAAIDGIGPTIAAAVAAFFAESHNRALIERLRSHGVTLTEPSHDTGTALSGQTFVITGTLPNLSRSEAKARIEQAGGRVVSAVSKKTTVLVVGESPGSKVERATTLGVEILDEDGLLRRIGAGT